MVLQTMKSELTSGFMATGLLLAQACSHLPPTITPRPINDRTPDMGILSTATVASIYDPSFLSTPLPPAQESGITPSSEYLSANHEKLIQLLKSTEPVAMSEMSPYLITATNEMLSTLNPNLKQLDPENGVVFHSDLQSYLSAFEKSTGEVGSQAQQVVSNTAGFTDREGGAIHMSLQNLELTTQDQLQELEIALREYKGHEGLNPINVVRIRALLHEIMHAMGIINNVEDQHNTIARAQLFVDTSGRVPDVDIIGRSFKIRYTDSEVYLETGLEEAAADLSAAIVASKLGIPYTPANPYIDIAAHLMNLCERAGIDEEQFLGMMSGSDPYTIRWFMTRIGAAMRPYEPNLDKSVDDFQLGAKYTFYSYGNN